MVKNTYDVSVVRKENVELEIALDDTGEHDEINPAILVWLHQAYQTFLVYVITSLAAKVANII